MGWRDRAVPVPAEHGGGGGGWRSRAVPVDHAGEEGAGGERGSTSSPADGAFQLPHPERPVEGLEYDAKTHEPMGSLTGPANPIRATAIGLANGATLGNRAKAAAWVDSHLPQALGGKPYDDALADERNTEALNEKVYPTLTGASHFAGVMENPIVRGLGAIGSTAKGLMGVGARLLGSAGAGAVTAAGEAGGNTDRDYTDPQTIDRMKTAGKVGAAGGAAAQLVLGEPVRAIAGALGNQIGRVGAKTGELADAEIASAQGLRGKQGQEAVGGRRNIELEAMMERNAPRGSPSPPSGLMGIPPGARRGDPLYHIQGATPEQARKLLVEQFRMVPEEADSFIQNEAAPYLARSRPTRAGAVRPAGGPAQDALNELGGARDDLKQRGIDNAMRAIQEEQNNPVQIPGRETAMGNAERQQNAQGWAEAKRGMGEMAAGAGFKLVGNPGGMGTYNLQRGVRRIARAALTSPAVINRLRSIPGAGKAIGNSAGKGSAALAATLYAMSADPKVAAELQKVDGELAQSEEQ